MKRKRNNEYCRIKPTSFYSSEREKTKLNYFCYELSVNIYDAIGNNLGTQLRKYRIDDEGIAKFSVHVSKRMKDIILQKLSGKIDKVYFSYEMVETFFPDIDDRAVNKILDEISLAWDFMLSICEKCPCRCISEKDAYCTMFDDNNYC